MGRQAVDEDRATDHFHSHSPQGTAFGHSSDKCTQVANLQGIGPFIGDMLPGKFPSNRDSTGDRYRNARVRWRSFARKIEHSTWEALSLEHQGVAHGDVFAPIILRGLGLPPSLLPLLALRNSFVNFFELLHFIGTIFLRTLDPK
jgi:hypothetical protein